MAHKKYDEDKNTDKDQQLRNIHQEALLQFNTIQSVLRDERQQSLDDRRFYSIAGAQWEGDLGTYFENKPKIEVNKIHLSVIRIINEYRNNKITVNFTSKDGVQNEKLADTCDGLYRADEDDSTAEEAYDNAFEEAVGGGIGAWRLSTEYEDPYDEDDDRQRIVFQPVYDADTSVYFDLNSKRQDKSDAEHCFVLTSMVKEQYEDEYEDDISSWPKNIENIEFDWTTANVVYIAEYFKVELVEKIIRIFQPLIGEEVRYSEEDFENNPTLESDLIAQAYVEVGQKKTKQKKIHKYILNGNAVMEDCGHIAGHNIPIVPVYGKRWFIDNVERVMGHVRLARDSQILKNIQLSKLAEISALSPVEKPIFTPEQVAGHEIKWAEDNVRNAPYMLLNSIQNMDGSEIPAGPIGTTKPPQVAPALAALLGITEQDMNDVLGNQQAGEKIVSNISGDAIELIQDRLDMQTFIYMSNMAKSMKRSGEIWLSMAKDIIVEEDRQMKVIDIEGKSSTVKVGIPYEDEDGSIKYENDLSKAKFGVNVEVGPATSSKKNATVRNLIKAMGAVSDPESQQVLGGLILMNMEGEGLADIRPFFRNKLIRMGAIQPNDEERQKLLQEAQNAEPTAENKYLESEATKNDAKTIQVKADTIKTVAETEKVKAETVETLAEVDREDREQLLKTLEQLTQSLNDKTTVTTPPLRNETDEIK